MIDFFDVWCEAAIIFGICLIPLLILLYLMYKEED